MRYKEATTGCWPFWLGGAVVLVTIIAFLPTRFPHAHAESVRSKAVAKDILVGMGHYLAEYDIWPDDPALATSDAVPVKVRGPVLHAVIGNNARGILFVDLPLTKPSRLLGLVTEQGVSAVHDSWGTCYFIMLDMNRDGQVKNPEQLPGAVPNPRAKPLNEFLPASTLVFSAGPDRDPNTWADNIPSWR